MVKIGIKSEKIIRKRQLKISTTTTFGHVISFLKLNLVLNLFSYFHRCIGHNNKSNENVAGNGRWRDLFWTPAEDIVLS